MRAPKLLRLAILISAFSFLIACDLGAETVNCTPVTAMPTTITTPGIYCLTADLVVPYNYGWGSVVGIQASNVVLDLNGHRIDGTAMGTANSAKGIDVADGLKDIVIRNGTIRGFWYGIHIGDSSPYTASRGHLVENILAEGNYFIAISVSGRGMIIQNNQIVSTGGSTYAGFGGNVSPNGIQLLGPGNYILNNDIVTVTASGTGTSVAIQVYGSTCALGDAMIVNNRINDAMRGINYNCGSGKYRDNLTSSVTIPYTGGTDAGNNN